MKTLSRKLARREKSAQVRAGRAMGKDTLKDRFDVEDAILKMPLPESDSAGSLKGNLHAFIRVFTQTHPGYSQHQMHQLYFRAEIVGGERIIKLSDLVREVVKRPNRPMYFKDTGLVLSIDDEDRADWVERWISQGLSKKEARARWLSSPTVANYPGLGLTARATLMTRVATNAEIQEALIKAGLESNPGPFCDMQNYYGDYEDDKMEDEDDTELNSDDDLSDDETVEIVNNPVLEQAIAPFVDTTPGHENVNHSALALIISGIEPNPGPQGDTRNAAKRRLNKKHATQAHATGPKQPVNLEVKPKLKVVRPTMAPTKLLEQAVKLEIVAKEAGEAELAAQAELDKKEEIRVALERQDDELRNFFPIRRFCCSVPSLHPDSYHMCSAAATYDGLGSEVLLPVTILSVTQVDFVFDRSETAIDKRPLAQQKFPTPDKIPKYMVLTTSCLSKGPLDSPFSQQWEKRITLPLELFYLCKRKRYDTCGTFYGTYLFVSKTASEYVAAAVDQNQEMIVSTFHRDLLCAALLHISSKNTNLDLTTFGQAALRELSDTEFFRLYTKEHPAVAGHYLEGYETSVSSVLKPGVDLMSAVGHSAGIVAEATIDVAKTLKHQMYEMRFFQHHVGIVDFPNKFNPKNELLAFVKRLAAKMPEPTEPFKRAMEAMIDYLISSKKTDDLILTETELHDLSAGYAASDRVVFEEGATVAAKAMAGDELSQATMVAEFEESVGSFAKQEVYGIGENKCLRFILAPAMRVRGMLAGLYAKSSKELLRLLSGMHVKGLTMRQIGAVFQEKFADIVAGVNTDYSNFESMIGEFRRRLENRFVQAGMHEGMNKVLAVLVKPFSVVGRFYTYVLDSIRRSGEYFTSNGNLLQNFLTSGCIMASFEPGFLANPAKVAREWAAAKLHQLGVIFEGDDGVLPLGNHTAKELAEHAIQAGARLTFDIVHQFEDVTFCKLQFTGLFGSGGVPMRQAFKDPVAVLGKLGVNLNPDLNTGVKDEDLQFAKCVSVLLELPGHPLTTAFARGTLLRQPQKLKSLRRAIQGDPAQNAHWERLFRDVLRRRGIQIGELMMELGVNSTFESCFDARPSEEIYAAVERVYGYSSATMKTLEKQLFEYALAPVGDVEIPNISMLHDRPGVIERVAVDARHLAREVAVESGGFVRRGLNFVHGLFKTEENKKFSDFFKGVWAKVALLWFVIYGSLLVVPFYLVYLGVALLLWIMFVALIWAPWSGIKNYYKSRVVSIALLPAFVFLAFGLFGPALAVYRLYRSLFTTSRGEWLSRLLFKSGRLFHHL